MRPVTTFLQVSVLCISIGSTPLRSQTRDQKPSFEVASIKPNDSASGSSRYSCCTGGLFRASNVDVKTLMMNAYDLFDYQIVGGPEWLTSARFDIQARGDAAADKKSMVQSLLEERFALKTHPESRDLSVYVLTVSKSGAKLQPMPTDRQGTNGIGTNTTTAGVELHGNGASLKMLIDSLVKYVQRPIVDKSGLSGKYDFSVKWSSSPLSPASADGPTGPDIFTALPDQLGLKLESSRGPVQVLVIESVQKPTPN